MNNIINHSSDNPRHLGRPVVSYGGGGGGGTANGDPGVAFVHAEYDRGLNDVVPGPEVRRTTGSGGRGVWVATGFPQDELLPGCDVAFGPGLAVFEGLPGVAVQVTRFRCGGFAVGVKIAHCLADAMCLLRFVHSWAGRSRVLFRGPGQNLDHGKGHLHTTGRPEPVFDPGLLDRHAGLAGGREMDDAMVERARVLPMHRFDWWATEAPGYPEWAAASTGPTRPGDDELRGLLLSPSTFPPWPTWDMSKPVDHVQILFSADEVARMKQAAQADGGGRGGPLEEARGTRSLISRLDALLAHMWILINRARRVQDTEELVYMDITLGLRSRVRPALPDAFLGSPILLGHVSRPGSEVCSAGTSIGSIALSIRETMALFTPEAVAAYLHDAAHEVSPQRLWQGFLGERHTIVTSWTRAGAYEVDFLGRGSRPRYVQGRMPRVDGVLQVMDMGETGDFDVSLCLERGAMGRLLGDEMLRAYER